jgi:regulatory protein
MSELGSKARKGAKQSPSLKARALRLLSLREYSRKGLAAKLAESEARWAKLAKNQLEADSGDDLDTPPKASTLDIEVILDDFEARGWLSDERFAEALVRRRSERYGTRKIQDELERAGVDSNKSAQLLKTLKETEYQRAYELWSRKFGVTAQEQKERARQYRFLASKGFSSEVVAKVIGGQRQD